MRWKYTAIVVVIIVSIFLDIFAAFVVLATPPGYGYSEGGVSVPGRSHIHDVYGGLGVNLNPGTRAEPIAKVDSGREVKLGTPGSPDNLNQESTPDAPSSKEKTDTPKKESAESGQTSDKSQATSSVSHSDSSDTDYDKARKYKDQEINPLILNYVSDPTKKERLSNGLEEFKIRERENQRDDAAYKKAESFIESFSASVIISFIIIVLTLYSMTPIEKSTEKANDRKSNKEQKDKK